MSSTFNPAGRPGGFSIVLPLVLVLVLAQPAASADPVPTLEHATRALNEGVPQVAVVRLRRLLSGKLPDEQRIAATAKLAEALVAAGEPGEALPLLQDAQLQSLPHTKFFHAQALAALSRWNEALPLYQQLVLNTASPFHTHAIFGQAEVLRALGRRDEALQALALLTRHAQWKVRARFRSVELLIEKGEFAAALKLLQSINLTSSLQSKERRFLRARIDAGQNNRQRAIRLFTSILKNPEGASHSMLVGTLFGIADAYLESGKPGAGDDYLEDYIEHHATDPELPRIFAKPDQLYAAQRKQSRHELGRWSNDQAQPRRALSQWYLARAELRLGRRDMAREAFTRLQTTRPRPELPALAEAFLEFAQLELEDQQFDRAIAILREARALRPSPIVSQRIELAIGETEYEARHFELAARSFDKPARAQGRFADAAAFNASLAWLQAGDEARTSRTVSELQKPDGDPQLAGELMLEQALVQAAAGHKDAAASLHRFLREFPQHARASEAWVALAEIAFHATPPQPDEARKNLARAAESNPTRAATERADYLRIWLEDATLADEAKVIAAATEFLQKHPESRFVPDVRMKLAETYYRRQDFASAQTQFEILAQQNASAPIAEKAQFFAAQSAMQSMSGGSLERALVLFDEVVKKNGELKWAARNEQAIIERKLGQPRDAMTLYDEVLRGEARAAEKREALCGKADILYEMGTADPENYRRAMELYDELATNKEASPHWRNQALFKKGMCLEKLARPADALAAFYNIVEEATGPGGQREFFWFYKAGFNAARLLEQEGKWQPAAAIYEKLAFAGGARSEEAKSRLNRLRLEHFLWEQ